MSLTLSQVIEELQGMRRVLPPDAPVRAWLLSPAAGVPEMAVLEICGVTGGVDRRTGRLCTTLQLRLPHEATGVAAVVAASAAAATGAGANAGAAEPSAGGGDTGCNGRRHAAGETARGAVTDERTPGVERTAVSSRADGGPKLKAPGVTAMPMPALHDAMPVPVPMTMSISQEAAGLAHVIPGGGDAPVSACLPTGYGVGCPWW